MISLTASLSSQPKILEDITGPLETAWQKIAEILGGLAPKVIGFLLILIIGWLISKFLAFAIKKLLTLARIPKLAEKAGIENFLRKGNLKRDTVSIISRVAYWFFIIITFIVAFNSVGLSTVSEVLNDLLLYFPNIFVALVILVIGFYLAHFVSGLVNVFAGNIGIEKPEIMGKTAYVIVMVFVIPIALNQLNIASELVTNAFLLLFGALCLALALAFGLGSREIVTEWLNKSKLFDRIKSKKE